MRLQAQTVIVGMLAAGWAVGGPPAKAQTAAISPVNLGQMTAGYTYYNRAGADLAAHNRDMLSCAQQAAKVLSADEVQHQQSMAPLGLAIASHTDAPSHRGA